jgi:hypothetical protein
LPTYTSISKDGRTYFTEDELKCKGSGKIILADGFADKLLELRLAWGKPMTPTSVCRTIEYNKKVGGAPKSQHICDDERGGCFAIDIVSVDANERVELVKLAFSLGWSVGISNRGFIHLDARTLRGEPQVIFGY